MFKIIKVTLLILLAFTGLSFSAIAAPAPTLFTYNDTTKECGTYRDGDEYVRYDLPTDWKTYTYEESIAKTTQEYCDGLGYTNIGSVVDYLDLQAITIMERPGNNTINTSSKNTKYVVLVAGVILLTGCAYTVVLISKKQKHDNS